MHSEGLARFEQRNRASEIKPASLSDQLLALLAESHVLQSPAGCQQEW